MIPSVTRSTIRACEVIEEPALNCPPNELRKKQEKREERDFTHCCGALEVLILQSVLVAEDYATLITSPWSSGPLSLAVR